MADELDFSPFYRLMAHYRRRLADDQEPLTREERVFLVEMLDDYENLTGKVRAAMERYRLTP